MGTGFRWARRAAAALLIAGLLCVPATAQAMPFTFSLLPSSGDIAGEAGSTIGWGYSLTNDSVTDWLMLTGFSSDPFFNAVPDSTIFDLPILAPGASRTLAFDAAAFEGLLQLTWDAAAPSGFTNSGTFVLSAEFWDDDPLAGGQFLSFADDQFAAYTATVLPSSNPVPEPATVVLMASGAAMAFMRRRRKDATSR